MHVFVAMPYHKQNGIYFDNIYDKLIYPALEQEGFEVFRADQEIIAGNIRIDMFQELLLADLVVADLSIDNPNVCYELGVRHALRARGVIQIKCKRKHMPFDVYTDRTLTYHIKYGKPDPKFLEKDKAALATMASETISSWYGRRISPVYHLLKYLKEPDWKSTRIDQSMELWDKHKKWEDKIEEVRKKQSAGDILVLADEAPIQALRLEAYRKAGKALLDVGQYSLASEKIEKALSINPEDLESLQQKGICLGRLQKFDQAKQWLKNVDEKYPRNAETYALLGRVEKDAWLKTWKNNETSEKMKEDAAKSKALLKEAIEYYNKGFILNPSHYYSGINTLTLLYLLNHLTTNDVDTEILRTLEGGVRWATKSAIANEKDFKYWSKATLAEIEVLASEQRIVEEAYRNAIASSEKKWFAVNSSLQQLLILRYLGFRPKEVDAAIDILKEALKNLEPSKSPDLVFLFSGHMIDMPNRKEPRFPNDKKYIDIAARAISLKLDELGAKKDDLALCGGACGGDLLFAEACLERGLHLEIHIPFDEPTFTRKSVAFAGDVWLNRFYKVKGNANTKLFIMPEELGDPPKGVDAYARNNLWQLYTALAWTPEKVRFICLWNRKEGDGLGGAEDMYDQISKHFGQAYGT